MYCSICTHLKRAEIILDWAYSGSLRLTASRYRVGYRSLQRHIDLCLASILSEQEQREYEAALERNAALLRWHFTQKLRKPRPKSIITKPVEFTWSRRAWKKSTHSTV
jgi:hypothetical protein